MQLYKHTNDYLRVLLDIEEAEGELSAETEARLNAIEGAFEAKVEYVAKIIKERLADSAKFAVESARMSHQSHIADAQARWLKDYLKGELRRVGRDRVEGELLKVALQNSPPSCTVDDAALPTEWCRMIPARMEPDKKAIIDALKAGQEIPGAALVQDQHIRIR